MDDMFNQSTPRDGAERPQSHDHKSPPSQATAQPTHGSRPATTALPRIRPGMTPEQTQAYIEGTKKHRSRKKPRPSLDKYRDFLVACVAGEAVMRQVFDDLVEIDPAVRDEFGPDGHRAFNACVKRMAEG